MSKGKGEPRREVFALFGGVYSNAPALQAAIEDALQQEATRFYCLGDLGAFGPHPDRVFPLLHEHNIETVQGNYDDSIGNGLDDCQCGYTDPRDNHFAQISYDYTLRKTSEANRKWMRDLPKEIRFEYAGLRFLLCHGSPRRTNEFLWESTTSTAFLNRLADEYEADVILATHTGLHWQRKLSDGRLFVNVGVLGRPANDGQCCVWYTLLTVEHNGNTAPRLTVEFRPVHYDHERLAAEMRSEGLPDEFVETILTGWWTTCMEVLPVKERLRGHF